MATKTVRLRAFRDRVFTGFAESDARRGPDDDYKQRATDAEREGRAPMLGVKTLEAVIKQRTKAEMIAQMQRLVLEVGESSAKKGRTTISGTSSRYRCSTKSCLR
jgi:hypothetical protein